MVFVAVDPATLARLRRRNRLETALTLLALVLLAAVIGWLAAGPEGLMIGAAMMAGGLAFGALPADTIFRQGFGASRLTPFAAPGLFALVDELSRRAGLAVVPTLYLLPQPVLQAVAAGTSEKPGIGLTRALAETLTPAELAGVLAHEVSHIRHGDLVVMRIAAQAAAITRAMAQAGLLVLLLWGTGAVGAHPLLPPLLVVAPLVSDLLALSLSRTREFLADAGAVELTGDPQGLASALLTLERLQGDDFERLASRGPRWLRFFRTHPTIAERVAALREATVVVRPALPVWAGSPWASALPLPRRRLPWRR
ncbi:MAG: zinc metalloprotease HtpX [Elioraea sp.]|nr:zinc metalloprotease HtpX [Elioraea sp.]MDW8444211.1 zinc metalloprotease HtpX [Acetobacteraceae bacterium]